MKRVITPLFYPAVLMLGQGKKTNSNNTSSNNLVTLPLSMPSCSNWLIQNLQKVFVDVLNLFFWRSPRFPLQQEKDGLCTTSEIFRTLGAFAMHQIPSNMWMSSERKTNWWYDLTITCWDIQPPSHCHIRDGAGSPTHETWLVIIAPLSLGPLAPSRLIQRSVEQPHLKENQNPLSQVR